MCLCCCYNICCCCNFCNSFSSRCIEISIFFFSLSTLTFSLLNIIIIKWTHLSSGSFVLLMLLVVNTAISTLASIAIIIYRFRGLINKNRNILSACLARIGLIFSVIIFFLSVISESIIQTNFKKIDYPCQDVQNDDGIFNFRRILISDKDFCREKGTTYYARICSQAEYTISYLSATINEFSSIILFFLWYNDLRRIKEKVEGAYGATVINQSRFKKRINFGDMNEQQINGIDSVNKHFNQFNQNQSIQNHVVLVKNNNKNHKKTRMSLPNINYKKDQKNFIQNLREEMKEGIESIDEEEDSSNKDSQNQKHDIKISIYKTNNRHNNENKNDKKNDIDYSEKSENRTKVEEIKENSVESPNIFL